MPRLRRLLIASCATVAALTGPAAAAHAAPALTPVQRGVADQLVSVFENSTTQIRYGYVEDLHDGCGFTAGRAGFCSATGDMLETVEDYAARRPGNVLDPFLRILRRRAAAGSASTRGLGALFTHAWRAASRDAQFRAAQDHVVDVEYFGPASHWATRAGVTSPLGVATFYDTAIEHGAGDDPDGLPALIARTDHRVGTRRSGVSETRWLAAFLAVRRADLLHPHNRDRQVDWPDSVGRVDALHHLLAGGHLDLTPPLAVDPWGDHVFTLHG